MGGRGCSCVNRQTPIRVRGVIFSNVCRQVEAAQAYLSLNHLGGILPRILRDQDEVQSHPVRQRQLHPQGRDTGLFVGGIKQLLDVENIHRVPGVTGTQRDLLLPGRDVKEGEVQFYKDVIKIEGIGQSNGELAGVAENGLPDPLRKEIQHVPRLLPAEAPDIQVGPDGDGLGRVGHHVQAQLAIAVVVVIPADFGHVLFGLKVPEELGLGRKGHGKQADRNNKVAGPHFFRFLSEKNPLGGSQS
ncbi:hypothetical protein ES703_40367 [subsurface metagenome]